MADKKKADIEYNITKKPVVGISVYRDAEKKEPPLEEMLEKQAKRDLVEAQKEEAVAKMEARTAKLRGNKDEKDVTPSKQGRDYIIVDDEPVRAGDGLGDYSLQDAKDILGIRALRSRFAGPAQAGSVQSSATEKVSELLVAMEPYINKGSDATALKEMLADKLALQRQEILSHIPPQGQPAQPKSFMEQVTEFIAAMGSIKEAGPTLRSIFGIPETPHNPSGAPAQVTGPDGKPIVMDLGNIINWRKFEGDERRTDERHGALVGLSQTVRENIPDAIQAILKTVAEVKGGTEAKPPTSPQQQVFKCGDCGSQFSIPDVPFETVKCPTPACGREYSKEELLS